MGRSSMPLAASASQRPVLGPKYSTRNQGSLTKFFAREYNNLGRTKLIPRLQPPETRPL